MRFYIQINISHYELEINDCDVKTFEECVYLLTRSVSSKEFVIRMTHTDVLKVLKAIIPTEHELI